MASKMVTETEEFAYLDQSGVPASDGRSNSRYVSCSRT